MKVDVVSTRTCFCILNLLRNTPLPTNSARAILILRPPRRQQLRVNIRCPVDEKCDHRHRRLLRTRRERLERGGGFVGGLRERAKRGGKHQRKSHTRQDVVKIRTTHSAFSGVMNLRSTALTQSAEQPKIITEPEALCLPALGARLTTVRFGPQEL